jgi:hypothetical protein
VLRRWVALLIGLLVGLSPAVTTSVGAASFTYDVSTVARVDVHEITAGSLRKALLGDMRGKSALPTRVDRGPSTTPIARSVATESGVRLRPGAVQPGVERTYDMALNPQAYIDATVKQYGINLRGSGQQIQAVYNPDLVSAGMSRAATPNVIEIGPLGMSSPEELARTLSHELNHARSFLAGGIAPESSAYAAEDSLSAWLAGRR